MKSHPWNLVFAYLSILGAGVLVPLLIFQETSGMVFAGRVVMLVVDILIGAANAGYWIYRLRKDEINAIESRNAQLDEAEKSSDTNFKACYRGAFTLVELLVVIGLICLLAAIAIAFFPTAASAQREARGAIVVQSWLNIAKQRALRDNAPRGVRFYLSTETIGGVALPLMVKDASYIEQTDDYAPGVESSSRGLAGASSTSPIVISTVAAHGLTSGQAVFIEGVNGNTAANGSWSVQVLTPTTFALIGSQGNGIYTSGGVWGMRRYGEMISGPPAGAPPIYTPLNTLQVYLPPTFPLFPAKSSVDLANGSLPVGLFPVAAQPNYNPDPNAKLWLVQAGDYIEISNTGLMRRIVQIGVPGFGETTSTFNANYFVVTPPLEVAIGTPTNPPTKGFKIMRSPRVSGDEQLKMPEGVYIDAQTNATFNNALPPANVINEGTGFFEILFAPNGSVISKGVTGQNINLWIRAPNQETPTDVFKGQPSLISVFVRTGFAGSFDVDPVTMGNPYTLVK